MEDVAVWRGEFGDRVPLFGPLPALRSGNVVAYEFNLPDRFVAWPGRSLAQRSFLLTDVGVDLSFPCWCECTTAKGELVPGIDHDKDNPATWYVDLVELTDQGDRLEVRDLFIDVMVPTDGRPYRLLDFDEFADAVDNGVLPVGVAVDALRRWQIFLDRYLHDGRDPKLGWSDFPPACISDLYQLDGLPGPAVTVPE